MMRFSGIFAALLLAVGCATNSGSPGQSGSELDYLTLRWEAATPSNDVQWRELLNSGEPIALDPEVVLDTHHFAAARTVRDADSDGHFIELVMTAEGGQRMKELSAGNIGRRLAIVIEDDIIALAYVSRTIDSGVLNLPPMQDEQQAVNVARRINSAIDRH